MVRANSGAVVPYLHVLTDAHADVEVVLNTLHQVLDGAAGSNIGADALAVQVRVKGRPDRAHLQLATAVAERCRAVGVTCLVNDRADIALAANADGVHLGAEDLPPEVVRRVAGQGLLIGGTARDPQTAQKLVRQGVDYLGVGPIFATTTKDGLPSPLGADRLAQVAAAVDVPVLAIGGVDAQRLPETLRAGAHGAAVVSAVCGAQDPTEATALLLNRFVRHHSSADRSGQHSVEHLKTEEYGRSVVSTRSP